MKNIYNKFEGTSNWNTIFSAISDLIENQDLKELTSRKYIVGYICKKLSEDTVDAKGTPK